MSAPETIMFVRHGEKPAHKAAPYGVNKHGEPDDHSLSPRGWSRAGALAALFSHAPLQSHGGLTRPARMFATGPSHQTKSHREIDTANPTAERLSLTLETKYTHGEEPELAKEILTREDSTLVVWHHGELPHLLSQFKVINADEVPSAWPEDRFDLVWVLQRETGAGASAAGAAGAAGEPGDEPTYRFSVTPQLLLAGDKPVT